MDWRFGIVGHAGFLNATTTERHLFGRRKNIWTYGNVSLIVWKMWITGMFFCFYHHVKMWRTWRSGNNFLRKQLMCWYFYMFFHFNAKRQGRHRKAKEWSLQKWKQWVASLSFSAIHEVLLQDWTLLLKMLTLIQFTLNVILRISVPISRKLGVYNVLMIL